MTCKVLQLGMNMARTLNKDTFNFISFCYNILLTVQNSVQYTLALFLFVQKIEIFHFIKNLLVVKIYV
jgi:hypothetical protein